MKTQGNRMRTPFCSYLMGSRTCCGWKHKTPSAHLCSSIQQNHRPYWGKDKSRYRQQSFLNVSQGIAYLLREKTPVDMRNTWLCIDRVISHTFFQQKYQEKSSTHQSASIRRNHIQTGWKYKKHWAKFSGSVQWDDRPSKGKNTGRHH